MSQLLFVRGPLNSVEAEGVIKVKALDGTSFELALDRLCGGRRNGAWYEVCTLFGQDFATYFDAAFQFAGGADSAGHAFIDVLRMVAEQYEDIVLSYGPPEVDIPIIKDVAEFGGVLTRQYGQEPAELCCALLRSPAL